MNQNNENPKSAKELSRKEKMVERLGVFFAHKGIPRIHGKVFAFLLVSTPPHQDFFEIQQFVKASKSSISVALKALQDKGLIEYITFPGDRRRYFKVDPKGWQEAISKDINSLTNLTDILSEVLEIQEDTEHQEFYDGLKGIHCFHKGLIEVLTEYLANCENNMQKNK